MRCTNEPIARQANRSEKSTIEAWLQVERILARCQADLAVIPVKAAARIAQISLSQLDRSLLRTDMNLVGRPIVGLVKQLRTLVGSEYSDYVHFKATTQDIMDTAVGIQMKQGLKEISESVDRIILLLDSLSKAHRDTLMIGRTNGQYALPIFFKSKLQLWISELFRRKEAIEEAANRGLLVQIGGPVGDLSQYENGIGQSIKARVAERIGLGLTEPHWQNSRDGLADIINALGALCASLCKIAHNVNILSSSDIGELSEGFAEGKGASSSMAHKKNQRASEFSEAVARLGRQRSEQINEITLHEHERSGGVWIAEWIIVPEVFLLTSGALMWSERLFENIHVHDKAMLANINRFEEESGSHRIARTSH